MAKRLYIPIWKTAPFIRLLPPIIAGILLQWYGSIPLWYILTSLLCFGSSFLLFAFLPQRLQYKLSALQGVSLNLVLLAAGALLCWQNDGRHQANWYGHVYNDSSTIVATINEPLVIKAKSSKAEAMVTAIINNGTTIPCTGKLLLYFSKDSLPNQLHYGDQILINKQLQAIKNSGNPGAFNYERYASFQQIFHNAFLKQQDWVQLPGNRANLFQQFIFTTRERILHILRTCITNGKDELGIAEALLIGYTNDLDKDLVQAYSNTGVVHIIAISGMHLALIYGLLTFIFSKIPGVKKSRLLQAVLILVCLWIFSLLTGAAASVLRSAVMFTFITMGRYFVKQSSMYNSLATSAMVMLCYNPYYLWDVGFQLSYLAVIGIVSFQKPIYHLFYTRRKWLDYIWQATALTTAAQLLTFPVCIYYFHQFPLLFLITNLVAVPISTAILYAEIALVLLSWFQLAGHYAGMLTGWMLSMMNRFILWINHFPFAVWDQIPANLATTWLLYAIVVFGAGWLMQRNRSLLRYAMASMAAFLLVHALLSWQVTTQQKIIVYNVPRHQAIDFVAGSQYYFVGDSALKEDGLLQNFHLKPARIAMQMTQACNSLLNLTQQHNCFQFGSKRIAVIDEAVALQITGAKIRVDAIVLCRNARISIPELMKVFNCTLIVFDGSNSLWKIDKWKQACDELNLRHYSIPEQGAYILDINS